MKKQLLCAGYKWVDRSEIRVLSRRYSHSLLAKMRPKIFLAAFLALVACAAAAEKKVVCYFGSWAVYRPGRGKFDIAKIQPNLCTHMIYTFVGITDSGDVRVLDSWQDLPDNYGKDGFGRFNALRKQSPNTKTLIAIGGWNEGSTKYSKVVSNPTTRARFVKNVVAFLKKYDFDGFDLDWEYPNQRGGVPSDKENFIHLVNELRAEFDKYGYLLTAAVAAAESSASQSYNIKEMAAAMDFINVMTYDFHGTWEHVTGINSPLYNGPWETGNMAKLNVNASIHYWMDQGAPAEKLCLGLPLYGRGFTLANPSNNKIGAPTTGPITAGPYTREPGMLGYNEICEYFGQGGWTVVRDEHQRVPYAYKGNQWFGFDDMESIAEKSKFINDMGLGGAMVWSIETDDFNGVCGEKYPLLNVMNHILRGNVPEPPTPAPTPKGPDATQPPATPPPSATPPPTSVCSREGYVRDNKDCGKFYYCQSSNGRYIVSEFNCASGLYFDPKINACNYPSEVSGC